MSTLLIYAPAMAHTKQHHLESSMRIGTLLPFLERHGVMPHLSQLSPVEATVEQLQRVHAPGLIEYIRHVSRRGGGLLDHGDTYATTESYDLARLAAGACITAVDAIMNDQAKNGFALIRPPGHHAEYDRISGFCLFNNVAMAARHAQVKYGVKRILIFDFDVHHGNGTQDIFYDDNSVLFISTHLFMPRMFYPGSGSIQETGIGEGRGYTLNVPLTPYVGDVGYGRIVDELIRPAVAAYQPELILVSAGFDAHWQDPLAMAGLSLTGYAKMAQAVVRLAEEWCHGRILFVLEGGYQLDALTYGILNVLYALLGRDDIQDPLGAMPQNEQDVTFLLQELKQRHLIS
jgi:acetoin utilization deacetylase AcuC-like enzyme